MTYLVDQKVVYFSVPALGWHCYKEKVGVSGRRQRPAACDSEHGWALLRPCVAPPRAAPRKQGGVARANRARPHITHSLQVAAARLSVFAGAAW